LRFWVKVNVLYSRGQQAINSVSGEGMAGELMWTNQVAGAMLVVVKQWEVSSSAGGMVKQASWGERRMEKGKIISPPSNL